MLKKIFKPSSFGLATLIIGGATFVSYVAGFFRDVLMTGLFGADGATDAYYASITLVDNIYTLTTAGALMGVLLPVFRRVYLKDRLEGQKLMGSWMFVSQIVVLIVSGLCFVFMNELASLLYRDLVGADLEKVVFMSRVLLLSPILFTISNSIGVVLHSFKHYLSFALSSSFYNVGIILGLVFFSAEYGVDSIVIGTAIGLVFHLLIRLVDVFFVEGFNFNFAFWHPELKQVFKLSIPKTASLFTLQITLLVYNMVGLGLEEGSISAFNYARNIQGFVVSMFGVSLATAVFPFLIDLRSNGDMQKLREKIEDSILRILVFALPAAVGLGVLSVDVVNTLFNRGAFDENDLMMTSVVLALFAMSICFESLNHLLIRVYNCFENTVWPMLGGMCFVLTNILVCYSFADKYGVAVFGWGYALGFMIQVCLLLIFLNKFIALDWKRLFRDFSKIFMVSGVMGGSVYAIKTFLSGGEFLSLVNFGVSILVGVVVYALGIWFWGVFKYTGFEHHVKKLLKYV